MNKTYIVIALIIGLFLILFYWFQIRPATIRSECGNLTAEKMNKLSKRIIANDLPGLPTIEWKRRYDLQYENCLHKKGM